MADAKTSKYSLAGRRALNEKGWEYIEKSGLLKASSKASLKASLKPLKQTQKHDEPQLLFSRLKFIFTTMVEWMN